MTLWGDDTLWTMVPDLSYFVVEADGVITLCSSGGKYERLTAKY